MLGILVIGILIFANELVFMETTFIFRTATGL